MNNERFQHLAKRIKLELRDNAVVVVWTGEPDEKVTIVEFHRTVSNMDLECECEGVPDIADWSDYWFEFGSPTVYVHPNLIQLNGSLKLDLSMKKVLHGGRIETVDGMLELWGDGDVCESCLRKFPAPFVESGKLSSSGRETYREIRETSVPAHLVPDRARMSREQARGALQGAFLPTARTVNKVVFVFDDGFKLGLKHRDGPPSDLDTIVFGKGDEERVRPIVPFDNVSEFGAVETKVMGPNERQRREEFGAALHPADLNAAKMRDAEDERFFTSTAAEAHRPLIEVDGEVVPDPNTVRVRSDKGVFEIFQRVGGETVKAVNEREIERQRELRRGLEAKLVDAYNDAQEIARKLDANQERPLAVTVWKQRDRLKELGRLLDKILSVVESNVVWDPDPEILALDLCALLKLDPDRMFEEGEDYPYVPPWRDFGEPDGTDDAD